LESLLEVARGVGKLSHSSLGLLLHPWWVFPLLGLERKISCDWEMEMRMRDAIGAWNGCQEPWEKACIFTLVFVSSLSLQFVDPRFSSMES